MIKVMNDFRTFLHLNIYNNTNITRLISFINKEYDLVSIQDITDNRVTLKIKKMNMKKISSYNNDVVFYYNIINKAIIDFLNQDDIISIIRNSNDENILYALDNNLLSNPNLINLLYNIVVIDDTSIMLYL